MRARIGNSTRQLLTTEGDRRPRRKWPIACCIAIAALWLPVSAMGATGFCETKLAMDYQQPLREMPPLRGLPEHQNELPFGPAGLSLINKSNVQVASPAFVQTEFPQTRKVGFALSYAPTTGRPTPRLDWSATGRLTRVGVSGTPHRVLATIKKRLIRMSPDTQRSFLFDLAAQPSMYRLEIEFRSQSGQRLGRFGVYLRVLRPTLDARIALNAPSFRPGDTVSACLENFGSESLMYGPLGYEIQSFDGSAWVRSAIDPPHTVPFGTQLTGPGEAAPAGDFAIPGNAPAGLYRWFWSGETWNTPNPRAPLTLTSEFRIDAAG